MHKTVARAIKLIQDGISWFYWQAGLKIFFVEKVLSIGVNTCTNLYNEKIQVQLISLCSI